MSRSGKLDPTVTAEITKQLIELKEQINREMMEDFATMKSILKKELTEELTTLISKVKSNDSASVEKIVDQRVSQEVTKINQAIVATNNKQLTTVKQNTKEIIQVVARQIKTEVRDEIIGEINEKIVPQVENMCNWVNYNMQDGAEVVTDYRRAVEAQTRPSDLKLLTDGSGRSADSRVISQHVRMVFSEDQD